MARRAIPMLVVPILVVAALIACWPSSARSPSAGSPSMLPALSPVASSGTRSRPPVGATSPARSLIPTWAASCPAYAAGAVDASAVATLGPSESFPPSPVEGERFVLQGVLLSHQCDVRDREVIDVWHTDASGIYGPFTAAGELTCCYYRGRIATDAGGRFELHTIRPATDPVAGAELPAHIHLALVMDAGTNPEIGLVFADDPTLGQDGPVGGLQVEMERRADAAGEYWYGFVVIRI